MVTRLQLDGVLTAEQASASADFILRHQRTNGAIPWYDGSHLDPWDHVESAMGLTVSGHWSAAWRALEWSARSQRRDGSWPMVLRGDEVEDAAADTNQCAYLAVGLWHFYLVTGRTDALARLWPAVESAINFVIRAQLPGGELGWAVDPDGNIGDFALLTGSSSALQSIECACFIASTLGHDRPRWRWAGNRLAEALRERPESFADRSRFSMDWYYPVLAGALRGDAATERIAAGWDDYVRDGHGVRCVNDQPWITSAESAEFVATLDAMGETDRATQVLADLQSLRDEETGGYWTGRNLPDMVLWPREQTTWSAAAVLLGVDAVTQTTGGASLWRDACWSGGELSDASVGDGAAS
ncbi:prenyltransferase [Flexivirga meconopsidis]|uniref:prenyltransferase n=1 Tax=Flexivirga meconopsidis TaxID=2977121 RepID=UPI00223F06DB|nr:prenyltransferase [Flexivirga meconopsidis]